MTSGPSTNFSTAPGPRLRNAPTRTGSSVERARLVQNFFGFSRSKE